MRRFIYLPIILALLTCLFSLCLGAVPILSPTILNNAVFANYQVGQEVIEKRTEKSKTYYLGGNRYSLESHLTPIHYKENPKDEKSPWLDIDTTIVGGMVSKAPYDLTIYTTGTPGYHITSKDSGEFDVRLKEARQDDKSLVAIPPDAKVVPKIMGNTVTWTDYYPGVDIIIKADNASVTLQRLIKNSSVPLEYDIDIQEIESGVMHLEPLKPAVDTIGQFIRMDSATIASGRTETLKLEVLDVIKQPIAYPIKDATTINNQPTAASADDAREYPESTGVMYVDGTTVAMYSGDNAGERQWGGMRWEIAIPQGATIGVAHGRFYWPNATYDDANGVIYFEYGATPAAFTTTAHNIDTRTRNTTGTSWVQDGVAGAGAGYYNTPDCAVSLQEVVDDFTTTYIAMICKPNTDVDKLGFWYSYDNGSLQPQIYIEYTAVSVPTVVTNAATTVLDTSANVSGNITVTGGENCDIVGIQWGISSANYTTNVTSEGSYGVGSFSENLTSLPTGTTIYFRAEAHNSAGYGYGSELTFLTKPAAPTNVAASDGTSTSNVTITWTKATGATDYHVWRDAVDLGTVGDVATYDDGGADAPTITAGNTVASDGSSTSNVSLSLSGTSANNGTTHTYKVVALNATGNSSDSSTDTGYRDVGTLTYQWLRSASTSDADYSNIDGATSSTYEDAGAPSGNITAGAATASDGSSSSYVSLSISGQSANHGEARYYKCVLDATGANQAISASNSGYKDVGSLTYQWQRSSGDADEDYSNIDGATTASYNDTDGVIDPDGRYYQCIENATGTAQQTSSSDRGYKALLPLGLGAPATFTLTDLGGITVTANWTMGDNANSTIIEFRRDAYPTAIGGGESAYSGNLTSANITGLALDVSMYYFSAWGDNGTAQSENYTTASIGGEIMEAGLISISGNLSAGLSGLGASLESIGIDWLTLAVIALFLAMVIRKDGVILKALGVPVAFVYGFVTAGEAEVFSSLWVAGVAVGVFGLYLLFSIALENIAKKKV